MEMERTAGGRYIILGLLGKGGMSTVYLAEDLKLHRHWAMKAVDQNPASELYLWKKQHLLAEAALIRRLDHPGFPRIVDLFEDDTAICVVMDCFDGVTLEELVRREGPQNPKRVLIWARQLCDMLNHLHMLDPPVIYRDLKPSNIICRPSGQLCIVDFGIASMVGGAGAAEPAGSRGYAPPEQVRGAAVDARADIYSLGMTLWYLLTGITPRDLLTGITPRDLLTGITPRDLLTGITPQVLLTGITPRDAAEIRNVLEKDADGSQKSRKKPGSAEAGKKPGSAESGKKQIPSDCSEGLVRIIQKCTEARPAERYQSAEELMRDLLLPEKLAARVHLAKIRKNVVYGLMIAATVIILATAVFRRGVRSFVQEETYRASLRQSATLEPQKRKQSILKAVQLEPEKPEAYLKLLELYETDLEFGDEESSIYLEQFNFARFYLSEDQQNWSEILYRTGRLYFFRFQGGDGSARERILRAQPFFAECRELMQEERQRKPEDIPESSPEDNPESSPEDSVRCFDTICTFYKTWLTGSLEGEEPDRQTFLSLLEAFPQVLEEENQYTGSDAARVKLTMLREFADLLNGWRTALCAAGIPRQEAEKPMQAIRKSAEQTNTLQEPLLQEKDLLLKDCERFLEQIRHTWEAAEQKTAE